MKIAFYNHTSTVSGAEISLLLTARNMRMGEPVIFAPEGELLERARESGLSVIPIQSYRARLSKNPLWLLIHVFGMLWAGLQLAQLVRRHHIQLIHANSLRAGIMAAMFVWLHRCPLVWHVRDIPPKGLIGKMINLLAASAVDAVIGISRSVIDGFAEIERKGKTHLVHNGVELQEKTEIAKQMYRKNIRAELRTPLACKVLVIAGQITPWKRQEDAIRAAGRLLEKGHDVYLWIVGEAKFRNENKVYESRLRQLAVELGIQDRVRFTGFRKDMLEICCAADVLLLCSDNEPFGRVIIEAMSQSVPVIGTNAGGVPEIIEHEQCGLLYTVSQVDELVDCADRLLKNKQLRQRMGKLAVERVKQHFTIQSTVAKVEDVYRTVMPAKTADYPPLVKEKELI